MRPLHYQTKAPAPGVPKPGQAPKLTELTIATLHPNAARSGFGRAKAVADAVFFTRDLVSEPANIIYPESLAKECILLPVSRALAQCDQPVRFDELVGEAGGVVADVQSFRLR